MRGIGEICRQEFYHGCYLIVLAGKCKLLHNPLYLLSRFSTSLELQLPKNRKKVEKFAEEHKKDTFLTSMAAFLRFS